MGCVASKKKAVSVTPAAVDSSGALRGGGGGGRGAEPISASSSFSSRRRRGDRDEAEKKVGEEEEEGGGRGGGGGGGGDADGSLRASLSAASSRRLRLRNLHRYLEGEQVAAGWPPWLSAVAGEAIHGWVPLKADSFEKLEKIGQGTYSSVFKARDLDTGKIVALKKVRFDNFEPESVRFMAREIQILRRLDHLNVMKLEGLITSRLSCSLYLVFEYMEHDLAGLSSSPDIKFSESQVKCYMQQLLSGLEHCHSRGIIHRDIKGANLLVNNEGVLKMGDFGLANFFDSEKKQPLTSRVVTLWYRPPELLLGSTDYEPSVDLWSVGCVFAEMFLQKPILQGRTEVEQLHKIFKLCGSPPDEYWKKSKLPHATIFKPHLPYQSCLRDTFKSIPESALSLLEVFLAVEPYKRGTASAALASEYFKTKPYACELSSIPKYPPNKEIDAKIREESYRNRVSSKRRGAEATRRPSRLYRASREPGGHVMAEGPEVSRTNSNGVDRGGLKEDLSKINGVAKQVADPKPIPASKDEDTHIKNNSQDEDISFSGPLMVSSSSGFAWARKQREERANGKSHSRSNSRGGHLSNGITDQGNKQQDKNMVDSKEQANGDVHEVRVDSNLYESHKLKKRAILKKWTQLQRPDSFDSCDMFHSQDLSNAIYLGDTMSSKNGILDQGDRVEFSGPLLSQSHKVDEFLQKHERHVRQAVRKSWFRRVAGRKQAK
ncbi:probable serine/threonine-protein kinase At1g54610 [Ananas comosus]|uniref:[RNA-polymerase]-subunit kinase n=1 Tax=Ananas comosus TaxID=4615 RepID=A0A6P5FHH2_ANACO|nr:probable serine/threonine-protein kinase At1g54610 [Ananas comosus]